MHPNDRPTAKVLIVFYLNLMPNLIESTDALYDDASPTSAID
jgi:hypothetical protein